jgi:cardiolipin synthase A/B
MLRRGGWPLWGGIAVAALGVIIQIASCQTAPAPTEILPDIAVGQRAFAATMEAHTGSAVVGGNTVDVLLNGDQIFPAKLSAIQSARVSITYAEYFYTDGAVGREVAEALAERCRAGVVAHVLLDGFGTLTMPGEYVELLRAAGCRVATFRPLGRFSIRRHNYRNHRRVLVVDGQLGITGGSGVSDKWTGNGRVDGAWRDTDVRITGPAVKGLQGAFAENWREATGELLGGERYFPEPVAAQGSERAQVIRSSPALGSYAMYTMYLLAINGARRFIYVTNPYFVVDERMEAALLAAVRRGVRVVALTPGKIDHNVVRSASRRSFGRLLQGGIEIWEYQATVLHAKTMVVDGRWATIGSTNFDNRSFGLNDELNVAVDGATVAGQLARVFDEDLAYSNRVTYEAWAKRPLQTRLLEFLAIPIESQL